MTWSYIAGLGIYSDTESDGEGSDGEGGSSRGDTDSDEELRQTIKRKRRDFQATERDILQRLQAEEMAERSRKYGTHELESEDEDETEAGEGEQEGVKERRASKDGEGDRLGEQQQTQGDTEEDISPHSTSGEL